MSLLTVLETRRAEAGPLYLSRIEAAARELSADGVPGQVKQVGDSAPDFALPDHDGRPVGLSDLLRSGPVVISFFRGEWCPFCQAELDALLAVQPAMARLDATLLLMSPEPASDALRDAVGRLPGRAHVLQDPMLGVALQYGLVHLVPEVLRRYHLGRGFDMARELSTGSWLLPLPADFIVDRTGRIALAYADPDFTRRLDATLLLETLGDDAARP